MYKTETHLHTSEVSPCAHLTAAEMVARYHAAGYKTVIITDHFQNPYFERLGDIPWEEKVERFLQGYDNAVEAAKAYGMHVILSAEIRFNGSPNHYLLLGVDRAFLKQRPDVLEMGIEAFYPYAKQHGVTVIQAHPYRDGSCYPTWDYADGVEAYNTNPRHENYTKQTVEQAQQKRMPITSGSDAHRMEDTAIGGVLSQDEIRTAEDYVRLLLTGQLEPMGE